MLAGEVDPAVTRCCEQDVMVGVDLSAHELAEPVALDMMPLVAADSCHGSKLLLGIAAS